MEMSRLSAQVSMLQQESASAVQAKDELASELDQVSRIIYYVDVYDLDLDLDLDFDSDLDPDPYFTSSLTWPLLNLPPSLDRILS